MSAAIRVLLYGPQFEYVIKVPKLLAREKKERKKRERERERERERKRKIKERKKERKKERERNNRERKRQRLYNVNTECISLFHVWAFFYIFLLFEMASMPFPCNGHMLCCVNLP